MVKGTPTIWTKYTAGKTHSKEAWVLEAKRKFPEKNHFLSQFHYSFPRQTIYELWKRSLLEGAIWKWQQLQRTLSLWQHRSNHLSISITIYRQMSADGEGLGFCFVLNMLCKFIWKKNYLLRNVNQRRRSKQSERVQSNNDHLGGRIWCYQLLKQLPGAGGQASIMMHVLKNRDQLQFQVHRCS